jgi:hypothetical protein
MGNVHYYPAKMKKVLKIVTACRKNAKPLPGFYLNNRNLQIKIITQ